MKKLILLGAALAALPLTSGCAIIHSAQPGATSATGEIWYTKTTIFIIPISNKVMYCDGKSNVCKEAEIH